MKKTIIILSILVCAALIAFCWTHIDEKITQMNYPLKYTEFVDKYSQEYSVPKHLIYAVIKVESGFESDAVSKKGAIGLMQIMPATYEWIASKLDETDLNQNLLYNPEINIKYGTFYLDWLYSKYGSWEIAVAAYNAGHGNVDGWIESGTYNGDADDIPFKETREYVKKVMKAKDIYKETYFEEQ